MSTLGQRMNEAMVLRGFAERTRETYLAVAWRKTIQSSASGYALVFVFSQIVYSGRLAELINSASPALAEGLHYLVARGRAVIFLSIDSAASLFHVQSHGHRS